MQMAHPYAALTDEELAARVQKGETDIFGVLVERYQERLTRYGRRFLSREADVTDLVQDTFIRAYERLQSFDTLQKFSPWIYRVAHNVFVNEIKRASRNPLSYIDFDTLLTHPVYVDPLVEERESKEVHAALELGLQKLPPKYREVLVLYYIEDLSYKEIADVLEVPAGTVGVRLRRAKEALAKLPEVINLRHDR